MIASPLLTMSFIAFALAMAGAFAFVTRKWVLTGIWLAITGALGASQVFNDFGLPPPMLLFFVPTLIAVSVLGWRNADRFSIRLLVGFQAFRIVVELLIHQAVVEGVAPPQMTWSGRNLDILSGVSALALLPIIDRAPLRAIHAWNLLSWGLLINVLGVAILSMPTPFQQIEPDNTWVAFFPWIWLPTIHVALAWGGHVALLKKLTR